MMGMPNAAVLPLPVWAWPMTSWPRSAGGMAPAWIGVAMVKPISPTVVSMAALSPSRSKGADC